MGRPINANDFNIVVNMLKNILNDDTKKDNVLKYIEDGQIAKLLFTPTAWSKANCLTKEVSTEIQWHGTVDKIDDKTYLIKDILVFPHQVSATTVVSDETEYAEWLNGLDDETFNHLRFHGHSHVNMSCSPSGTDTDYRKKMTELIKPDCDNPFYIFMIMNKKGEYTAEIYDIKENMLFSTDNKTIVIDVVLDNSESLINFKTESLKMIKSHKVTVKKAPVDYSFKGWYQE